MRLLRERRHLRDFVVVFGTHIADLLPAATRTICLVYPALMLGVGVAMGLIAFRAA